MSKRGPTSELNHDNWDQEEPKQAGEDMLGGFTRATPEQLQNRVIKSAKRRSLHPSSSDSPKSPFTSFTGFGTQTASIPAKPSFSSFVGFGAGLKNGHGEQDKEKETVSIATVKDSTSETSKKGSGAETKSSSTSTKSSNGSTDYFTQLQGLNISVSKWISQHVNENPCCILTPVFKDYEKHLANIEKLKKSTDFDEAESSTSKQDESQNKSSESSEDEEDTSDKEETPASSTEDIPSTVATSGAVTTDSSSIKATPSTVDANASSVQSESAAAEDSKKEEKSPAVPENQTSKPPSFLQSPSLGTTSVFGSLKTTSGSLFGSATTASSDGGFKPSGLTFSFGNNSTTASNSSSFQFGSGSSIGMGSTFSFASQVAKATQQQSEKKADEDQESEEPPKVEFQPVEEEGSVYSIKCKVFVKKDSEYKDRGVGMLYLKAAVGDSKAQLLVRTATTTGQILLNSLVTNDLRPARQGKNNVQIVCIPTPNESPAITLIRVKTGEDADELLAKIKEHTR
ncbi:hypothetical protein B566_EDAN000650 [Ephemera danica]|nr:hypothetical protein B566_EDAN000650 [Ephemera danica]